jgi:hypothetical protein
MACQEIKKCIQIQAHLVFLCVFIYKETEKIAQRYNSIPYPLKSL